MAASILTALIVSVAINAVMFGVAFVWQSDKLTDISYAVSFLAIAVYGLAAGHRDSYHYILFALVAVWALRIGGFLLVRVMKSGKDRRFDGVRENFWKFGRFWLGQAMTAWVLMLPVVLADGRSGSLSWLVVPGLAVWLRGFYVEAAADLQKSRFRRNPANKGKWIDEGYWHYARHPNYYGEMLVWAGVYLYCVAVLRGWELAVGAVSPVAISLLLRVVSGVPPLEKSADERWGNDPAYQAYKKRTALMMPRHW